MKSEIPIKGSTMIIIAASPHFLWDGPDKGKLNPATGGLMLHTTGGEKKITSGARLLLENTVKSATCMRIYLRSTLWSETLWDRVRSLAWIDAHICDCIIFSPSTQMYLGYVRSLVLKCLTLIHSLFFPIIKKELTVYRLQCSAHCVELSITGQSYYTCSFFCCQPVWMCRFISLMSEG